MDGAINFDDLVQKDHQATLKIINQLGDCQTRGTLNQILKKELILLLDCNFALYVRIQKEQTIQLLDTVNQSSSCANSWKSFLKVIQQTTRLAFPLTGGLTVQLIPERFTRSFFSHSNSFQENSSCAVMAIFDALNPTFACFFCRMNAKEEPFMCHEISLLRIIRPSLLQAIKAIIWQEDYQNLQQTIHLISGHTEPWVIARNDGTLMYQSDCFEKIVMRGNNTLVAKILDHTITIESRESASHLSQVKLGKRNYKIVLTLVQVESCNSAPIYLIRFLRTNKINGSIFSLLREAGLTSREQEISVLLYQGIPTREISEQTHISYHTVRNHIKSIYCKMNVSTRSEMLAMIA